MDSETDASAEFQGFPSRRRRKVAVEVEIQVSLSSLYILILLLIQLQCQRDSNSRAGRKDQDRDVPLWSRIKPAVGLNKKHHRTHEIFSSLINQYFKRPNYVVFPLYFFLFFFFVPFTQTLNKRLLCLRDFNLGLLFACEKCNIFEMESEEVLKFSISREYLKKKWGLEKAKYIYISLDDAMLYCYQTFVLYI